MSEPSVSGSLAAFANSIGVNGRTATTGQSPDCGALSPTGYGANQRAGAGAARGGYLIAVLLPKTPPVPVAIPNARAVRVPSVTVPVPWVSTSSG
ncbi:MAG: hypothetical protein ACREA9_05270, partial [Pyrinomonadaceae bacterium]